ncbi:MAG: hypothetical protein ACH350_06045 [Parachlamydiaceae bacterium]
MYKDATYKKKFGDLQEWMPSVIEAIKKDLRNEHLKKDVLFVKKFLSSKNIHKVTTEELAQAYHKAIQEQDQGEELAEFVTSRWLLKNTDLYEFFEKELTKINPDFAALEEIAPVEAYALIEASIRDFGALHTYLFAVLNSVVFPQEVFEKLKAQAQEDQQKEREEIKKNVEQMNIEQLRKNYEIENARLTDKYEKKLAGMQKKYTTDMENLKKQMAQLQRKLHEKSV